MAKDTKTVEQLSIETIRTLAMDAVQQANAGHPGTAMALAPVAYVLYRDVMRANPSNPDWPDRDRFVLSAGHACILQYAALHLTGYNLALEEIKRFRQWESLTPGHPEHFLTPGIETTTGPLGQGISNAVGMAMAEKFLGQRYNRPGHTVVDHRVYGIASDGDLMEGVSQEAASLAGAFGLGKLTFFYDDNRITIDGTTALSFDSEDKGKRFEAYGWHVQHVADVNDLAALRRAVTNAQKEGERPSLIVVRSHIAYPAPNAQDTAKAHGAPLGEDEVRATKEIMGWDPDAHFVVPEGVYEHMNLRDKGQELEDEWHRRWEAWRNTYPDMAEDWDRAFAGELKPGWAEALPEFDPAEKDKMATRAAGAAVMEAFKNYAPTMLGGAADLVESTKTNFDGAGRLRAGLRRAEHPLRRPRARDGLDRERPGRPRRDREALRLDLPHLQRLHAAGRSPLGAHGPAGRLGLDARLGRPRRGRPDPSARRALHGAPGNPELLVLPPGRCERDLVRVEGRARAQGRPGRARAEPPGPAGARPLGARRRGRGGARRVRPLGRQTATAPRS